MIDQPAVGSKWELRRQMWLVPFTVLVFLFFCYSMWALVGGSPDRYSGQHRNLALVAGLLVSNVLLLNPRLSKFRMLFYVVSGILVVVCFAIILLPGI
jgi:hypothetical protein